MKFIVGLVSGVALGAAGAVYYTVKTGRDFRSIYAEVRSDIDNRDYDALGQKIEKGFAELQAEIEVRLNQVRATTTAALEEAQVRVEEARLNAEEVLQAEADQVDDAGLADAAGEAVDTAADTASDVADSAADVASDAADALADAGSDAADAASDAVSESADAVGDAADDTADAASDAFDSSGTTSDDRGSWYQER